MSLSLGALAPVEGLGGARVTDGGGELDDVKLLQLVLYPQVLHPPRKKLLLDRHHVVLHRALTRPFVGSGALFWGLGN